MSNAVLQSEFSLPEKRVGERIQSLGQIIRGDLGEVETSDYLRPHQLEAVHNFKEAVVEIAQDDAENEGMSLLHPTGSGKTITAAEILRLTVGEHSLDRHRALMLVPSKPILRQTVGSPEEPGALSRFTEELSPAEYHGTKKRQDGNVVVMTYQSLGRAVSNGVIDRIDPTLVVCDEAHHVIDGKWAKEVAEITADDRLLLGLTATPAYTEVLDVSRLFPREIGKMSIKEGIELGVLANLSGYMYQGGTTLSLRRSGRDYSPSELFKILGESEDNYLAAKICAQEVAQGGRGVVSCVPGYERAHSRIMSRILNETDVSLPDGSTRKIRAAHVDGGLTANEFEKILRDYRNGDLDVLTYVDVLLEGWDSPESDFAVLLRPTLSRVLAEQRVGRITRAREGKIAKIHEIVYESTHPTDTPVTHVDVLEEDRVRQGYVYGSPMRHLRTRPPIGINGKRPRDMSGYDDEKFVVDPDLAARMDVLDSMPMEELRIVNGTSTVPLDWTSDSQFAHRFNLNAEDVRAALQDAGIAPRQLKTGDICRDYYPPRALAVVARLAGYQDQPEDYLTLRDIISKHSEDEHDYRDFSPVQMQKLIRTHGIEPTTMIDSKGRLVKAYPSSVMEIKPPIRAKTKKTGGRRNPEKPAPVDTTHQLVDCFSWLESVLVSPTSLSGKLRYMVDTAQKQLVFQIRTLSEGNPDHLRKVIELYDQLDKSDLEIPEKIEAVLKAKKISVEQLLLAALKSKMTVGDPRLV